MVSDLHNNVRSISTYLIDSTDLTQTYWQQLESIVNQESLLQRPFNSIKIAVWNKFSSLVPADFFSADNLQLYLKHIATIPDHYHYFSDKISEINGHNVFAVRSEIAAFIKNHFPIADFFHGTTAMIHSLFETRKLSDQPTIYAHLQKNTLHLLCLNNRQLQFSNSFSYRSSTDLLYFILLVYNQFKFSQEAVPLFISGNVDEGDEIHMMLKKYISNLSFIPRTTLLKFGLQFKDLQFLYLL